MSKDKIIQICDFVIEWCFYALLATITFSNSLIEIASTLMIAAWIIKKIFDRDLSFFKLLPVIFLLAYILWALLSCFNSDYFKESFRGVFKVLEYSVIFMVAATSLRKEAIIKRSFYVIVAVAIIICVNGIIQYFLGYDLIRHRMLANMDYLRRISSSFIHPNNFGAYLVVISMIFISLFMSGKVILKNKLVIFVALILSVVCLIMTKSRGPWLSFVAALLTLGALKAKRVLAAFLIVLLVLFMLLPQAGKDRIASLADLKSGTTWERLMLWKGTINMVKVHPVLGFGINTYSRNFPKYRPPEYPDIRYTHNSYLQMASEIGIVGALFYLFFLIGVLIYCFKGIYLMKGTSGIRKDYAVGLFAGLVGFSLNSAVDTFLFTIQLAVFFHLLLGYCFSLCYHAKNE